MLPSLDLSFSQAVSTLEKFRLPSAEQAVFALSRVQVSSNAAVILRDLRPEVYSGLAGAARILPGSSNPLPIEIAAIDAVAALFPVDTERMLEFLLNWEPFERYFNLELEKLGFVFNDDDFFEAISTPYDLEAWFSPSASLYVLIKLMDMDIDDPVCWSAAGNFFGWPEEIRFPWKSRIYTDGLDIAGLKRRLKRRKMEDFFVAFEVIWRVTGNVFYDLSDEDLVNIPFTLESVRRLIDAYASTDRIRQALRRCELWVLQDPSILVELVRIFHSSSLKQSRRPKSLSELWDDNRRDNRADMEPIWEQP